MHQHHEHANIPYIKKHVSSYVQKQAVQQPLWTQDEAIAYECAKETLGYMRSICTTLMDEEKKRTKPNDQYIKELKKKYDDLWGEQERLRLKDSEHIKKINVEYGKAIKIYTSGGPCPV